MPTTSTFAPTLTSAQVPRSNVVVAASLTLKVPIWNCSVGQAEPAVTLVTTPSPSIGCGAGGVVGGVVGAMSLISTFEAATLVPVLMPLTSSLTPGWTFAQVPPSNAVAAVTETLKPPIMKLNVGHDVPATSEVTGASPSISSPSLP